MNTKLKIKMSIDIGMTVLLFVLMSYQYVGNKNHEIAGAAMFVLFILHHLLNLNWYKNLGKGKYTLSRVLQVLIDVLLLVVMIGLMISGIAMSRHVFRFLDLDISMSIARKLHMTTSYLGFLLMGFHIGLHYGMIMSMVKKMFRLKKEQKARTYILRIVALCIAGYGVNALIQRDFITYILLKSEFAFMDYEEPAFFFLLDYTAVMGLMIFIAYYFQRFIIWAGRRQIRAKK